MKGHGTQMMYDRIFLDLDGTLLDIRQRLYQVFCTLTQTEDMTFEKYWHMRLSGMRQDDVLKHVGICDKVHKAEFRERWKEEIESVQALSYDIPQQGADGLLRDISVQCDVYLWTNRRSREGVKWQLDRLGWSEVFSELLVTGQQCSKQEMLIPKLMDASHPLVVSDDIADCMAAVQNKCTCIFVNSGMYSVNATEYMGKVCFCSNLEEVRAIILQATTNK